MPIDDILQTGSLTSRFAQKLIYQNYFLKNSISLKYFVSLYQIQISRHCEVCKSFYSFMPYFFSIVWMERSRLLDFWKADLFSAPHSINNLWLHDLHFLLSLYIPFDSAK